MLHINMSHCHPPEDCCGDLWKCCVNLSLSYSATAHKVCLMLFSRSEVNTYLMVNCSVKHFQPHVMGVKMQSAYVHMFVSTHVY